jgi:hypothetical protein
MDGRPYRPATLPNPYKCIGFGGGCQSIGSPLDRASEYTESLTKNHPSPPLPCVMPQVKIITMRRDKSSQIDAQASRTSLAASMLIQHNEHSLMRQRLSSPGIDPGVEWASLLSGRVGSPVRPFARLSMWAGNTRKQYENYDSSLCLALCSIIGLVIKKHNYHHVKGPALCYAIVLPGRKSAFRAGFRPDSNLENIQISPPAGQRPTGGSILRLCPLESGRDPTRKLDFRPGSTIG